MNAVETQLSSDTKVVLVVSTGRTGTKAFAAHIARGYPEVRAEHEPVPSRSLRASAFRCLCGELSKAEAAKKLSRARRNLLTNTSQAIYVESNPVLTGFLEVLDDVFHEPKVLHIVRDPRTFVRSAINFGALHGIRGLLARTVPYWFLKPEYKDPSAPMRWSAMNNIQRMAWYWSEMNRHLDRGQDLFGDRYRCVKYEDVFNPAKPTMQELLQWFGIAATGETNFHQQPPARVNASRQERCQKFENWSTEEVKQLLYYCGDQMKHYEYQLDTRFSKLIRASVA